MIDRRNIFTPMVHIGSIVSVFCAIVLSCAVGFADERPRGAEALALYKAGKELYDAKRYKEACEKLEGSNNLESVSGTLFALGACYDKRGKVATGYSFYSRALEEYQKKKEDKRIQETKEQMKALEPRIPKLIIHIPAVVAALPGLVIRRNGDPVPRVEWETAISLDPDEEATVEADAAGYSTFRKTLKIGESKTYTVTIDKPERLPWPTQRKIALALGGLGVVGTVVGSILGGVAMETRDKPKTGLAAFCGPGYAIGHCGSLQSRVTEANDRRNDVLKYAHPSTAMFAVGLTSLTGAVILWVTTPKTTPAK